MAVGDFAAGSDPAGDDPVVASSAPRTVVPPAAAMFSAGAKDFLIDAAGLFRSTHPVDQRVALKLSVRRGTLASAPDIGHTLNAIKRLGPSAAAQAKDAVNVALADELKAGDIQLLSVLIDTTTMRGGLYVVVNYMNLRTQRPNTINVTP